MTDQFAAEDVKLQFARQLYETSLERRGPQHQQTRLLFQYMSELEKRRSRVALTIPPGHMHPAHGLIQDGAI